MISADHSGYSTTFYNIDFEVARRDLRNIFQNLHKYQGEGDLECKLVEVKRTPLEVADVVTGAFIDGKMVKAGQKHIQRKVELDQQGNLADVIQYKNRFESTYVRCSAFCGHSIQDDGGELWLRIKEHQSKKDQIIVSGGWSSDMSEDIECPLVNEMGWEVDVHG